MDRSFMSRSIYLDISGHSSSWNIFFPWGLGGDMSVRVLSTLSALESLRIINNRLRALERFLIIDKRSGLSEIDNRRACSAPGSLRSSGSGGIFTNVIFLAQIDLPEYPSGLIEHSWIRAIGKTNLVDLIPPYKPIIFCYPDCLFLS